MALSRSEWLAKRQGHIGASEAAAAIGKDLRYGPLHVYEAKITGYSMEDNEVLEYGRDMEQPIAKLFKRRTGRTVHNPGATRYHYHPEYPWLAATLDRKTWGNKEYPAPAKGAGAMEIKNIDIPKLRPEDWTPQNEAMLPYIIQNQIQMSCAGLEWGCVCGKFPYYNLCWFDQLRNDDFLEAIYPLLGELWDRIQRRDPPQADELQDTQNVVKRLWKNDVGTTIDLSEGEQDWVGIADNWEKEKETSKSSAAKAKSIEAKIRAKIKDNTFGNLGDGTLFSLKTDKGGKRVLRRFRPRGI